MAAVWRRRRFGHLAQWYTEAEGSNLEMSAEWSDRSDCDLEYDVALMSGLQDDHIGKIEAANCCLIPHGSPCIVEYVLLKLNQSLKLDHSRE